MITFKRILIISSIWIVLCLSGLPSVIAIPTTGAATEIGSNNVTIPVAGITGTDVWVVWGQNPGGEIWNTANYTPSAGSANVLVWGAPLLGSTLYYAKACDQSGCGNEISFTTAVITPLPTTTFGAAYKNLSDSHFNIKFIPPNIERVYVPNFPRTLLYGMLIGLVFVGLWFRTRSIRLCSSLGIILGVFLWSSSSGLYLGIPLQEQLLGQILLAAGIAGWILSLFVKK